MTRPHPLHGLLLMIAFCATAPLLDTCAKLAAPNHPVGQIAAARFVVQAAILVPLSFAFGQSWRLGRRGWALTFLRAALIYASTLTFVAAIAVMPMADALAIVFVEPFILMGLGWVFLKETVGPRRIFAALLGFIGTLIVVRPGLISFGWVALLPLATGALFAAYMLVTRMMRDRPPFVQQGSTAVAALVFAVPLLVWGEGRGGVFDAAVPQGIDWLYLAGMGAFATLSHLFLTAALRLAPAATLAPLSYVELVFSVIFGLLIFGDFPSPAVWLGAAIIVGSGLYVIHRERLAGQTPDIPDPRVMP